jgi:type I restriction enzyme S subunit
VSDLGFLEKLLDGAEVEWLPLEKVTDYEQPTKYLVESKNYDDLFNTPVLTAGKTFILGYTDETTGIYEASKSPTIIFDDFTTANKWVDFDFKAKSSAMKMITSSDDQKFNIKYLYYWLNTLPSGLVDGDHKRQWIGTLSKKLVPIPCPDDPEKSLAIQGEIVRILDTFTKLTAELTAELAGRKKQYNHYRDQLYCFENTDVEWKILGDVCDFQNGFAFKSSLFLNEGLPIIRIKNVSGGSVNMDDVKYFDPTDYRENTDAFTVEKGDILVAMSGATTGKIGYYAHDFIAYLNQRVGKFLPNVDELNARYLYHFLLSQNQKIYSLAGGGAQPNLSSNALKAKINIPIPYPSDPVRSVAEQERIAIILDKLDTLTTSLSEGLPREIALRQQQYEYYRDLLLSFPKPAEAVEA